MRNRVLRGLIPALALAALPTISPAGVFIGVSVNIAPPPLPVYVQPPCPQPGYIWVPGYWAWNDDAYYWVPGTWVLPPRVGLLWTPGYWGWDDDDYVWHAGYWGPHVGFYGGVPYGYGYDGDGFDGGYWRGGVFFYNRAVMHVGPTFVTNVYYHPVSYHDNYEHVSYNGGPGGIDARPRREDFIAEREHHVAFTPGQERQQRMAFEDRRLRADYNHGRPPVAATVRPAVFHGSGAFAARAAGGPVHYGPMNHAAPMRADRPSWATGQSHGGRPMERDAPMHAQQSFGRPQQRFESTSQPRYGNRAQPGFGNRPQPRFGNAPQARYESRPQPRYESRPQPRYESRPQPTFEPRAQGGFQPRGPAMERPQYQSQPQFHQQFRPQERAPMMRGGGPREQPRGGERPQGPPQEHRGGRGR